jgi:penicillin-binding protein 2
MSSTPRSQNLELKNIYRFGFFAIAVAFGVTSLGARMAYLQVYQGPEAYQQPSQAPTATQEIPSTRGLIYDAAGNQLVKNVIAYTVSVTPADLPLSQETLVATRIAAVLNADPVDIETRIDSATGSMYTPVKVAENVDTATARFIEENADALPGVSVSADSKRQYLNPTLYPTLFSQIIGYTGQITERQYAQLSSQGYLQQDVVGQAGVENSYESVLRGTYGTQTIALDSAGKPIPGLINKGTDPIPGSSLTLTIDTKEQEYAQKALQWGLTATHVQSGVIIVENPQNGAILAMVSLPTYNDQLFADGISETDFQKLLTDPNQPLLNKAIGAQYAPGSTYKLVTGTAGLQDQPRCRVVDDKGTVVYDYCTGYFNDQTKLLSQPAIVINGYPYKEWNKVGWGLLDIKSGLAHSSDTFFYQLSRLVGVDRLAYWAQQYGFGRPTGIDLPGEAIGIVPDNQWKIATLGGTDGMFTGEILQAGIGQGYDASTALQLLDAYCALANGGNLWQPHVVQSITPPGAKPVPIAPTLLNKLPASAQTLETMREATRAVVTSQHTYNLVDLPVKVAGKTGTAEFGVKDRNGNLPYSEWFVGYTPGDPYNGDFSKPDSQLAVVAFVYGADSQGNVATEIVKYFMMEHYGVTRYPLSQVLPYKINIWTTHRTNFYNLGVRD